MTTTIVVQILEHSGKRYGYIGDPVRRAIELESGDDDISTAEIIEAIEDALTYGDRPFYLGARLGEALYSGTAHVLTSRTIYHDAAGYYS